MGICHIDLTPYRTGLNVKCKGTFRKYYKQSKMRSRDPAGIYLFIVNSRNTRTRCEICPKLTIKIPERR